MQIFLDKIERRRRHNMNTIFLVVGDTRSGKSSFAIRLGQLAKERLGMNFGPEHIHFRLDSLKKDIRLHKNTVIVADEVGVSYDSMMWWSEQNRMFKWINETMGYKLNCLIMTCPDISFLNKPNIKLVNYLIVTVKQGIIKCYKVKQNRLKGNHYVKKIVMVRFKMPSDEYWKPYMDQKIEFTDKLLEDSPENDVVVSPMQQAKLEHLKVRTRYTSLLADKMEKTMKKSE